MLDYVENAYAIEHSILRQLDSMISSTDDFLVVEVVRHHKEILIASPGAERLSKGAELRPYTLLVVGREKGLRIALA
jgi:hypothetical protein